MRPFRIHQYIVVYTLNFSVGSQALMMYLAAKRTHTHPQQNNKTKKQTTLYYSRKVKTEPRSCCGIRTTKKINF